MRVEIKSSRGSDMVELDSKLFGSRFLYLNGEITNASATEFCKELLYLENEDATQPIYVFVDSPGGSVRAGWKILDYINSFKDNIYLICDGSAYSMAAVIMCAAKKGHRLCTKNSCFMIHEPWTDEIGGNSSAIKTMAERMLQSKEKICLFIAEHTGKSKETIENDIKYDHFFSVQQAIQYGLVDKEISITEIMSK